MTRTRMTLLAGTFLGLLAHGIGRIVARFIRRRKNHG